MAFPINKRLEVLYFKQSKISFGCKLSTVNGDRGIREELKQRNSRVKEIYVTNTGPHVREDRKYFDFEEPVDNYVPVNTNGLTPEEALRIVWPSL